MKENHNIKILDELYEIREGEVEKQYIAKYGEPIEINKAHKADDELVNFMKKFIKDEKDMQELFNKLNNYELKAMGEMCFWYKPYYKTGFIDAVLLQKQVQAERIKNKCNEDSIYDKFDDIWDYVDKTKYDNLKSNEYYNKIKKELIDIYSKYPRVEKFIYDEKIEEFTPEEMKAILKVISLYNERFTIEAEEMFKIGVRTGKSL